MRWWEQARRCQALTLRHGVGGEREEESGVLRRLKSASEHQTPCTVKRLLYVDRAATGETRRLMPPVKWNAASRQHPAFVPHSGRRLGFLY